jgi:DNA-directed RNA polymerase subunit RPC12/RpoP
MGEKPYKCDTCGKSYNRKGCLQEHEKGHKELGTHLFKCDTCGKDFNTKSHLESHTRRPYRRAIHLLPV